MFREVDSREHGFIDELSLERITTLGSGHGVTVFNPLNTRTDQLERLVRGEGNGIPWILPLQYHLGKFAAKEILK